jgi:HisA/HisF family protein
MLIIPVVDIRHGVVVQAIAGNRREYRPIQSCLTDSVEPLCVVQAVLQATGSRRIYVADLDGILEQRPNWDVLRELCDLGAEVLLDAGVVTVADIDRLRKRLNCRPIVASETFKQIRELIRAGFAEDVISSLDLKAGVLQIADSEYSGSAPESLLRQMIAGGLRDVIVLDIAAVGTGRGTPTLDLCRSLRSSMPRVGLITGGGVHSPGCIQDARDAGLDGLLIASAIHDGRFLQWSASAC